ARVHLGAVDDLVAEPEEDVFDLADDLRQRVQPPSWQSRSGQRDVQRLVELPQLGALELALARRERRFEPFARGVERHPALAVADAAQRPLQLALPTAVVNPGVLG